MGEERRAVSQLRVDCRICRADGTVTDATIEQDPERLVLLLQPLLVVDSSRTAGKKPCQPPIAADVARLYCNEEAKYRRRDAIIFASITA